MALVSGGAFACSCIKTDYFVEQDEWALKVFGKAEFVAHVKVEALLPSNTASIRVIELFKGSERVNQVKGLVAPGAACGTTFTENEEAVFMVMDGLVNLCGKLPVSSDLSQAFRAISSSMPTHVTK